MHIVKLNIQDNVYNHVMLLLQNLNLKSFIDDQEDYFKW